MSRNRTESRGSRRSKKAEGILEEETVRCAVVGAGDGRCLMSSVQASRWVLFSGSRYLDVKLYEKPKSECSSACLVYGGSTHIDQKRFARALDFWDSALEIKRLGQQDLEDLLHVDRVTRGAKDEWCFHRLGEASGLLCDLVLLFAR